MFNKIKNHYSFRNYKRMWAFVKPYWFRALLTLLITIPIGSMDAIIALALKPFMDTVIVGQGGETPFNLPLYIIPIFIICFTLLQGVLEYASAYLNIWVGTKITVDLKKKMYAKLLKLDSAVLDKKNSGEIVYRFDSDPNLACAELLSTFRTFTMRIFASISLICVLFYTSWQLALLAIFVLGGALYPLTRIRRKIKDVVARTVQVGGEVLTTYNETFAGAKTIASYNLTAYQRDKFAEEQRQLFKLAVKQTQRTAWLSPMMHIIISFGIAGTIWYGSYLITSKTITAGDFVSFLTALLMLYTPIKQIGRNFNSVQLCFMAIDRIFDILDLPLNIKNKKEAVALEKIGSGIDFKNVSFEYTAGVPVLKGINLHADKGQTIALVGNSGGGKTTVVNLLPRFYDVNQGAVCIDGIDVRDLTLESLRDKIAVVFQDNFLFSGTIRENILLGKPDATDAEIDAAVKNACLNEFIGELENGLDTEIGERGVLLSGGQKQRIAIARAFVKNAPIVILDEATSALDNKSEAVVQQAIDNLMQDRTVFVIAHRLSTVRNADKIVVINEGEIVESGTHHELMALNGAYKSLYDAQFKHA